MTRWMVRMIVSILMKFYPAEIAGPGHIFPSDASRPVARGRSRRVRNCIRYVDCTRKLAHRDGRNGRGKA